MLRLPYVTKSDNMPMLEFAVDPLVLVALMMVAFLAGFIDAVAGGGGLLTLPALLTAGLPPHLVLGTNKLCATFGSATASYTFYRRKLFEPRQWRFALLATAIGAALGAGLAHLIPAHWLNQMLPVVVFACGLYLLFGRAPTAPRVDQAPISRYRQWPQGGTVSTMLLYPLDLLKASGVARSMNFVSNGVALAVFIISGQVAWSLGIGMGIALMIGAYLGARTAITGGSKFIRPIFISIVLALSVRLAWQHWFGAA